MVFGKHINKFYVRYGAILLLGIFALLIVDVGQLQIPKLYRMLINGINQGSVVLKDTTYSFDMNFLLDHICRPMIFVIVIMIIGRFLWRVCFFGAAINVEASLRQEMFDRSRKLSQQYYQVSKVGDIMSLYTNDIDTIQDCFGSGILSFFDALLLGSLALYNMFAMNVGLALLCLIPMIILFLMGRIIGARMMNKWDERQEAFSMLSDFSQETFSGIAVIKAFAKEYKELHEFGKLNKQNEKVNVEFTKISTKLDILTVLLVESVITVILGYGGFLVYKHVFDAGQLVEFIGYFTAIVWPIEAVAFLIGMAARAKASVKRVSELLDSKIDVCDKEGVIGDDEFECGDIEFKHLTFTHPGASLEALKDVSFAIKKGERVGIIGRTGAGKTTVADLIMRCYNVPDGTLFVGGHDVNDVAIKTLRNHLAYVPQDNFLFSTTISDNIAFAFDTDEDLETIEKAAKLSDVYENIEEFPDKFKTVLGERGVTVSGGQKQRISIARALMKDADILILDDAVSAVDTKTEKIILDNLKATREGKTTIMIAHRISTVEGMDKIIFIDEGRVVAVGTHEQLLASCKDYENLVMLQRLEDERKEREENA